MSVPLLKYTLRSNWLLLAIIFAIMFMYLGIMTSMYDPGSLEQVEALVELLPPQLIAIMGLDATAVDLTSFLASYYYTFLIFLFPMIYCIIVANRLIAAHVDRGSMGYLLSTPTSRRRIAFSQGLFLAKGTTSLLLLVGVSGGLVTLAVFPGELDLGAYVRLNLGAIFFFFALSGICFFFSCLFDDTRHSLALGGGIPVLFFVIDMLAKVSGSWEWLRYFTLFSLFDAVRVVAGEQNLWVNGTVLLVIGAVLYAAGIIVFDRRDLPL